MTPRDGVQLLSADLLKVLMGVAVALALVLGSLLLGAFNRRVRAERAMDDHLIHLIELRPDSFFPKAE